MEFEITIKAEHIELKQLAKSNDMARFLFAFEQDFANITNNCPEENKEVEMIRQSFYSLLQDYKINIEDLNT